MMTMKALEKNSNGIECINDCHGTEKRPVDTEQGAGMIRIKQNHLDNTASQAKTGISEKTMFR